MGTSSMSGFLLLLSLALTNTLGSPSTPQNVHSIVPEGAWDSAPAGALSKTQNQKLVSAIEYTVLSGEAPDKVSRHLAAGDADEVVRSVGGAVSEMLCRLRSLLMLASQSPQGKEMIAKTRACPMVQKYKHNATPLFDCILDPLTTLTQCDRKS